METFAKFGLPLLLVTILVHPVLIIAAIVAWRREKPEQATRLAVALCAWDILYFGLLAGVSMSSKPRTLSINETLLFSGFYLDSHIGASLTEVTWPERIGGSGPSPASRFCAVTVKISNSATREAITPGGLEIRMIGSTGSEYPRNLAAEQSILAFGGGAPLVERIPAGGSYLRTLVFEVPVYDREPRLEVTMTGFEEKFLIGDSDSMWHAGSYFSLKPASKP